jgi:hypothetical protein
MTDILAGFFRQMGVNMTLKRRKLIFIATFIIIAAVAVVLCVGYFAQSSVNEFDGTLVDSNAAFWGILC